MFLLLLLLFLIPLAVYCLALAMLNRRLQPTLVAGTWDFLGVLLAASGLLLVAVPVLLGNFFQRALTDLTFDENGPSPEEASSMVSLWWLTWVGYYVLVLGGGTFLVWLRRGKTVVYNVPPDDFDRALSEALAHLHLGATRHGNRLVISAAAYTPRAAADPLFTAISAAPVNGGVTVAPPRATSAGGEAVVDVERFPAMHNVTLHWQPGSEALRAPVEEELAKALKEVQDLDNPAGGWFLGLAGFLFALVFLVTMVLLLGVFFPLRR